MPHHTFHVFAVYPWLGLLRTGVVDEPLHVLDQCRTTPALVQSIDGDGARVLPRPLVWDGGALELGPPDVTRRALARRRACASSRHRAPGDWVSLHWDFVCDRLTRSSAARLAFETRRTLAAVNSSSTAAAALA